MAQSGAVPQKKLRANYGQGMHRPTGFLSGTADDAVYVPGVGIVNSSSQASFFAPSHTAISVYATSSNVNITIAPNTIMTAVPAAPSADPLRRVREEHDRVAGQATGTFSEVLRITPGTKYEVSLTRIDSPLPLTPPKGCCERFCNWLRCKP